MLNPQKIWGPLSLSEVPLSSHREKISENMLQIIVKHIYYMRCSVLESFYKSEFNAVHITCITPA
jgi:hypothetical protein